MVKKLSQLPELAVDYTGEEIAAMDTPDLGSDMSADALAVKPEEIIVEMVG